MARVYLSIGSNINQQQNICAGLDALAAKFGELQISSVYESEAIGFDGDNFYNLVVGIETSAGVDEISCFMKSVEDDNGRRRDCPRFSARTLDIDILTYDDFAGVVEGVELPRQEILENAFVLWPLAEIAASEIHPVVQKNYGELWRDYDKSSQKLWPVDFVWAECQISKAS